MGRERSDGTKREEGERIKRDRSRRQDRQLVQKKKRKALIFSDILLICAVLVFCYAGYRLVRIYLDYQTGRNEYKALEELAAPEAEQPVTEGFADSMEENLVHEADSTNLNLDAFSSGLRFEKMVNPIDFEELLEINQDVVGWLKVDAIDQINYPIVQGEDNEYYLHRTVQQTDNFAGSIFMDYTNSANFGDRNTILYGHNMKDGSMFVQLKKFRENDALEKSRYFWIYTPDYIYKYEIFSVAEVGLYGIEYQVSFEKPEDFEVFLENAKVQSEVQTDTEVKLTDTVVTLSTCTGDASTRLIVVGKRVRTYEAVKQKSGFMAMNQPLQE